MPAEAFGTAAYQVGDLTLVCVRGELDALTVPTLEHRIVALMTPGHGPVLLDLRELEFMDVAGLRLALRLEARAQLNGVRFAVVRGSPHVRRVFELTGMERFVPSVDDPRELVAA
jgi:anti-sigma B factor antagonist